MVRRISRLKSSKSFYGPLQFQLMNEQRRVLGRVDDCHELAWVGLGLCTIVWCVKNLV